MADFVGAEYLGRKGTYFGVAPQKAALTLVPGNAQVTITASADDTVIDGQTIVKVKDIVVRYSETEYPTSPTSGNEAATLASGESYTITGLANKNTYYFAAFSRSDHGVYNLETVQATATPDENEIATVKVTADKGTLTALTLTLNDITQPAASQTASLSGAGSVSFSVPIGHRYNISASDVAHFCAPSTSSTYTAAAGKSRTINMQYLGQTVYAFHINGNTSSPSAMVTYPTGCDNANFSPFAINLSTGVPDYGDWANAFFMPRPCMLKTDGTVDYYLNPDDYTKKADGTASDVANTSYDGNAMMEWGPGGKRKIWYKTVPDSGDSSSATVYISDLQADDDYRAWSFYDANNKLTEHFYTPCYNGAVVSGKLRSISGLSILNGATATQETAYAEANNTSATGHIWDTEVLADITLINYLLILMAKTTDMQTAYGYGHYSGGSGASNLDKSGTRDKNGLFYGTSGNVTCKVFGMENWWGNQWRRYAGHINASGTIKIKLTYGTADGSTTTGYNQTGSGYLTETATMSGTSGGYISKMKFTENGMFPQTASGSSSTYYCDGLWWNTSQTNYALHGGGSNNGLLAGAFCVDLDSAASVADWNIGASLSCKPLA